MKIETTSRNSLNLINRFLNRTVPVDNDGTIERELKYWHNHTRYFWLIACCARLHSKMDYRTVCDLKTIFKAFRILRSHKWWVAWVSNPISVSKRCRLTQSRSTLSCEPVIIHKWFLCVYLFYYDIFWLRRNRNVSEINHR